MPSQLFTPFSLRESVLPNRVVVSPMAQYSADTEGLATNWHLMHYGNWAVSGPGMIIFEAIGVEPRGRVTPRCLGLWNEQQMQSLKTVVGFCREVGPAVLGLQLAHSGRKGSTQQPWVGPNVVGPEAGGREPSSCSAEAYPGRPVPRALSQGELAELVANYVTSTRLAEAAGFDLVELHCAHGYLLHSFLSPLTNTRNDGYGGDLAGRMRFPLEVFAAVRAAFPADRPVGVRISATDWLPGGWDSAASVAFARALKLAGCDYVTASSGGLRPDQKITLGPGYQVPFAATVQQEAGLPTMAVGLLNDPDLAEQVLQQGQASLIALGRGMTWNPRWAWHAAEALGAGAPYPPQYARSQANMRLGDMFKPNAGAGR